jgi:hypothetical protein
MKSIMTLAMNKKVRKFQIKAMMKTPAKAASEVSWLLVNSIAICAAPL